MKAVAAICLSSGFSGWGTRSRPHICAVSAFVLRDIYGEFAETPVLSQVEDALNELIAINV